MLSPQMPSDGVCEHDSSCDVMYKGFLDVGKLPETLPKKFPDIPLHLATPPEV